MGFQSGINAALGTVAGAAFGIRKTLKDRQEEALKKAKEKQEAQQEQKQRFRKSPILNKSGENIMVPIQSQTQQQKKEEPKPKIQLFGATGEKL